MENNVIKFEFVKRVEDLIKLDFFKLPARATKKSAGYDFINPEEVVIKPKEIVYVKTGVKAIFPDDLQLKLYNRSSNPRKKHLILANGVGIVDADYYNNSENEGEIAFAFMNISNEDVVLSPGEKLGQGIFEKYYTITDEGEILNERQGGFGSTSK